MSERGDASVEFLGILVVLVIPVLYIVLAVGQVSPVRWRWMRGLVKPRVSSQKIPRASSTRLTPWL